MFWDKISPLYDIFENIYNGKVYTGTGKKVAELIDKYWNAHVEQVLSVYILRRSVKS